MPKPIRDIRPADVIAFIRDVTHRWIHDDLSSYAAAISFFTLFSIAPILLIAVAIASNFWGQAQVWGEIIALIRQTVGMEAAKILEMLLYEWNSRMGIAAGIFSLLPMFWGASKVFVQMQVALNAVWEVQSPRQGRSFVRRRLFSFVMVLIVGVWLVMSLLLDAGIRTAISFTPEEWLPSLWLLDRASEVADVVVAAVLFTVIYKMLPAAKVRWIDGLVGGVIAALLFALGRWLFGLYLVSFGPSAFGAAGSLIVLLVWVYYSVQMFLFSAHCSWLMSRRFSD